MGGGNSTKTSTYIKNKQLIVNKNDIKLMAQNINKSTTDIVQETTKDCAPTAILGNTTNHKFGNVAGDFISDTEQGIDGNLQLKCVQDSNMRTNVIKEIAQKMSNEIRNNMSADAFSQLQAEAKSAKANGFASMPQFGNKTEADSKIIQDLEMRNESTKDITNIISNITTNKFSNKNLQQCYATAQAMNRDIKDVGDVGGNVVLKTKQNIKLQAILDCVQKEENIMDIVEKSAAAMGLKVTDEQELKSETQVKSQATAESVATGPIEEVFGGVTGMLKGMTLPIIIGIVGCVLCVIVLGIVAVIAGPKLMEQANKMKGMPLRRGSFRR